MRNVRPPNRPDATNHVTTRTRKPASGSGERTPRRPPSVSSPFAVTTPTSSHRSADRVADGLDALVDIAVGILAASTVAYHVALVTGRGRATATAVLVALAAAISAVVIRSFLRGGRTRSVGGPPGDRSIPLAGALGIAVGAAGAGAAALIGSTQVFWALAFVTGAVALLIALRAAGRDGSPPAQQQRVTTAGVAVVAIVAMVFAVVVTLVRSPSADDTYYLNRALHAATHGGPFPMDDTIYADQAYPSVASPNRFASYESLIGIIASVSHLDVRTVYYLLLPALFGALGVLCLWRLARSASARAPALATSMAVLFLLFDGAERGWGDFSLRRLYQGKAVLLFVLVPWLWHHASTYARSASFGSLPWVVIGGVAAVGVSSSGSLIAPLVVATAIVPAIFIASRERRRSAVKLLVAGVALVYPVAVALITVASTSGPVAADGDAESFAREIHTAADAWSLTVGEGGQVLVMTIVVLAGWVLIRDVHLRVGLGLALFLVLVLYSAPGLAFLTSLSLSRVSWRFLWVLPLPAIVGLMVDAVGGSTVGGRTAKATAAVVIVAALALTSPPLLGSRNADFAPPSWDVDPAALAAAEKLVDLAGDEGLVAGPIAVSRVVPTVSTSVFVASARESYTAYLGRAVGPTFGADHRRALTAALTGRPVEARDVPRALDALPVEALCAQRRGTGVLGPTLREAGFERVSADGLCIYWKR